MNVITKILPINHMQSSRKLTSPTPEATKCFVRLVKLPNKLYSHLASKICLWASGL